MKYTNADFFGGDLSVDAYWADQAMRYVAENGTDRQLVKPAPPEAERIWDQSEINSEKKGLRFGYAYGDLFKVEGLRLRAGLEQAELRQERRALRLKPEGLAWRWLEENCLELRFALPPGCYATALVHELGEVVDASTAARSAGAVLEATPASSAGPA